MQTSWTRSLSHHPGCAMVGPTASGRARHNSHVTTSTARSTPPCTDPYNEDFQADKLTLSISVAPCAAAPERVEVTARGRASWPSIEEDPPSVAADASSPS